MMKTGIPFLLIAGLAALSACGQLESSNGQNGEQPQITGPVFVFSAHGKNEAPQIYIMDSDGSHIRQLTHEGKSKGPAGASRPDVNPEGRKIIYSSYANSKSIYSGALMVMNADGGNKHPLIKVKTKGKDLGGYSNSLLGREADWSPDSRKVIFNTCICGYVNFYYTYLFNTETKTSKELFKGLAINPQWSPDGKKITFWASDSSNVNSLYIINADGEGLHRLVSAHIHSYTWIGSDHLVYITTNLSDEPDTLVNVNASTGDTTILNSEVNIPFAMMWMFGDASDKQLIIVTKDYKKSKVNIYRYNLQGGKLAHDTLKNPLFKWANDFDYYGKTEGMNGEIHY
jgi:Tol biopolymer transport system component